MKKHTKNDAMPIKAWWAMLQSMANMGYGLAEYERSDWDHYYSDGFSPREALDDHLYNRKE